MPAPAPAPRLHGNPMGLLRLYDSDKRLLTAQYASERQPLVLVNNNLLTQYVAIATFTPTASREEADAIRANLTPLLRPNGESYLTQPGGPSYVQARYLADLMPAYAGPPFLVSCPDCSAGEHEPCTSDKVHKRRISLCDDITAERAAAYAADTGYIVFRGRVRFRQQPDGTIRAVGNPLQV